MQLLLAPLKPQNENINQQPHCLWVKKNAVAVLHYSFRSWKPFVEKNKWLKFAVAVAQCQLNFWYVFFMFCWSELLTPETLRSPYDRGRMHAGTASWNAASQGTRLDNAQVQWPPKCIPKSTTTTTTTATASATRCYYSSSCCYHPITFSNNFWVPCPMTCQKKVWNNTIRVHQRQPLLLASPLIIDHHEGLMSHNSTNSLKPISRISFLSTLKFGAQKNSNEHISWFLNMLQPFLERVPSRMFRKHVTKISKSTHSFEHPGTYHIPLPARSWSEVCTLNKPA